MIETSRRSLITGLISLIAAPAIVRVQNIMPVRVMVPLHQSVEYSAFWVEIARDSIRKKIENLDNPSEFIVVESLKSITYKNVMDSTEAVVSFENSPAPDWLLKRLSES